MFNVCDREGRHLGFVYNKSASDEGWQVALSKSSLDNNCINWELVKARLADLYESRNIWGKIKEEALLETVKAEWEKEKALDSKLDYHPHTSVELYKIMLLISAGDFSDCINFKGLDIDGFVFLGTSLNFYDQENLLLDAELDYVTERVLDTPPVFGIVADYPRIGINVMGVGEGLLLGANWSDFGGRNHTHATVVRFRSGKVDAEFFIPIQIAFKKGEPVQFYLDQGQITRVFYDGAIYLLNARLEKEIEPYSFNTPE